MRSSSGAAIRRARMSSISRATPKGNHRAVRKRRGPCPERVVRQGRDHSTALESRTSMDFLYGSNTSRSTRNKKDRSEEHTSELQSLMRISYAVFCLKKKIHNILNKIYQSIDNNIEE